MRSNGGRNGTMVDWHQFYETSGFGRLRGRLCPSRGVPQSVPFSHFFGPDLVARWPSTIHAGAGRFEFR